jgi:hypothetical protein
MAWKACRFDNGHRRRLPVNALGSDGARLYKRSDAAGPFRA